MASFGAALRRERELRGVSLEEIAASTKIGVGMLKAIEDDRLDKLPQGLFVRGFIREYARFLALDEQKILTELSFHTAPLPLVESSWVEEKRVPSPAAARLVNAALIVGGLGALVALIFTPAFSPSAVTPAPLPAVDRPSDISAGSDSRSSTATLAQSTPSLVGASVLPGSQPTPQPLQLTLTATEDCWIGLDVGGDRVENRVLKKGESFSITARQNASLAVGNAGGLLVAIDRGPQRTLGYRGEVKRNIPLSPEAIGALSAVSQNLPTKPIG